MRTRVKICGITNPTDAEAAVEAGADALGVVLAPGRRQVGIEQASWALRDVPPFVARVGVFVDAEPAFIADAVAELGLAAVQFHGRESASACANAPAPVIKAFRAGPGRALSDLAPYRDAVACILLDTYAPDMHGGTGRTFEWSAYADVVPTETRLVLAGGLTADNVGTAIKALRPFAVDVSSGVESSPGVKDPALMSAFVAAVAAADQEVRTHG
ncbi:MAG: phosphoribosylanthranilate isomerase [Actinomycetia bacterium]|nr:phosphoribosylanthranilate isomerase [Actinomycetes bacterium]